MKENDQLKMQVNSKIVRFSEISNKSQQQESDLQRLKLEIRKLNLRLDSGNSKNQFEKMFKDLSQKYEEQAAEMKKMKNAWKGRRRTSVTRKGSAVRNEKPGKAP